MSVLFRSLVRLFNRTTTPTSPSAGDLWWRSDVSQAHASDGLSGIPLTIGPEGNLPVVRSGSWHTVPVYGPIGSANFPADRLFALPIWPGRSCTLTASAVNVTLALAGGNIRMGLYASDGVLPTSLISDYGTVTVGVTGIRQISGLSTQLRPVLYYLGIARQGGILNLGLTSRDSWDPIVSDTEPLLDANRNSYYRDGVSGALPSSFGAPAGTVQGPAVTVRLT